VLKFYQCLTDTPLFSSAKRKCQRYFVKRNLKDAKSKLGIDEFQAIKYRAWELHFASTILASWFISETHLNWHNEHPTNTVD
jgi:hypothetical protein